MCLDQSVLKVMYTPVYTSNIVTLFSRLSTQTNAQTQHLSLVQTVVWEPVRIVSTYLNYFAVMVTQ